MVSNSLGDKILKIAEVFPLDWFPAEVTSFQLWTFYSVLCGRCRLMRLFLCCLLYSVKLLSGERNKNMKRGYKKCNAFFEFLNECDVISYTSVSILLGRF